MSPYLRILRTPGVRAAVVATVIGRLPYSITGLSILLYVQQATGSFATAGATAGALALGSGAGGPLLGRMVDRKGMRVMVPLAALHVLGLMAVWAATASGARAPVLLPVTFLTGVALPPVGSVLRSGWRRLLVDRPELLAAAYALDSFVFEIAFVTGPLITTAVAAVAAPQYALVLAAGCLLTGTGLLSRTMRGQSGGHQVPAGLRGAGLRALGSPGLRVLVIATFPFGVWVGAVEVTLPAFSEALGATSWAGVLVALWSVGSGIGAFLWGARARFVPVASAHLVFCWAIPLASLPLLLGGSILGMAGLVMLAGLPIAPVIASRNHLIERLAPPGTATEAFTWPVTAVVTGAALGAAVAGSAIEASSWRSGVVLAVVMGALGAAVATMCRHAIAVEERLRDGRDAGRRVEIS